MQSPFRSLCGILLLLAGTIATGAGARAAGPPPPPPMPGSLPAIYAETAAGTDTARFRFVDAIVGDHFKPGERVTVKAKGVALSPASATADQEGSFSVTFTYTLVFCGPGGLAHAAPVYEARGDRGSTARYSVPVAGCPLLRSAALRVPASGSHPFVSIRHTPLTVQGFGFVPGEQIALRELGAGPYRSSRSTSVQADARGRVQTRVDVAVPPTCSPLAHGPYLVASGDAGTAVLAPIGWVDPARISCQNLVLPPVTGAPSAYLGTPGHHASVHVSPARAAPGTMQAAVVQGDEPASPVLTLVYTGAGDVRQASSLGANMRHTFKWKVPASARGSAQLTVNFGPQEPALHASLTVQAR